MFLASIDQGLLGGMQSAPHGEEVDVPAATFSFQLEDSRKIGRGRLAACIDLFPKIPTFCYFVATTLDPFILISLILS